MEVSGHLLHLPIKSLALTEDAGGGRREGKNSCRLLKLDSSAVRAARRYTD
jgi:hypothetical protein